MKLRFKDYETANKFAAIVERNHFKPNVYESDDKWIVVESGADGKVKSKIMREWAKVSLEDNTKVSGTKQFRLF